jgi:hypothetical protein
MVWGCSELKRKGKKKSIGKTSLEQKADES